MTKKDISFILLFSMILSSYHLFSQNDLKSSENGGLIMSYLEDKKSDYNFKDTDIKNPVINNEYYSENTGVTHVYLNQTYQGIRFFNVISSIAIKNGEIVYYANRFLSNVASKINTINPVITPNAAIMKVAEYFDLGNVNDLEELERNGYNYEYSNSSISNQNINIELVYSKQEENLRLAWDLIIYDVEHWWSVRVDATTNEIIEFNDLILTCKFDTEHNHSIDLNHKKSNNLLFSPSSSLVDASNYNVFPLPVESPNHGFRQIVTEPASNIASPFGWHDTNGISGAEFTTTRGNNVWTKEDLRGDDSNSSFSSDGTTALNFDFPLDFDLSPLDNQDAVITNLFYMSNMMHDIWFHHGFDESSGNFQTTNYSNQGNDNDFVFADAQDGSGFNNANFGTPPDGFNPRMQMFLWSPPGSDVNERVVIENGSLIGEYDGIGASFGAPLSAIPITSNLVLANDLSADILNACELITNPAALNGNIAVLRRGLCQFGAKVLAVENAGAIGVIVVNNEPGAAIEMGPGTDGDLVTIPSIMVTQVVGEALIAALNNGENIIGSLSGPDLTDFIDGGFDNGIIAHEYGHGISNRLAGGPSAAGCLQNNEQMGEGWSDWFALMVTMNSTDLPNDGRGIGTFAIDQSITGGGIRPARYNTDFADNGFTYNASNTLSQPHGVGFVWATMLWDLTWAYIDKYGFDSDLYNGNGGNNKVMKLVIDGLKLQPCSPGFVDGRDAILAADMIETGGVNQCLIWEVFVNRGLGVNAVQGDTDSRDDQIEDFTMPLSSDMSLANCSSLSVDEFDRVNLTTYPNPMETELSITSIKNLGNVNISIIDINGRIVFETQKEAFNNVTIDTSKLQSGLYILRIKGFNFNYNEKIIKN